MARQHVRENLALALDTLRTHKGRSFLTVLGVLIGTMTVIAVASVIAGLDKQVVDLAEGFGTRTVWIYKLEIGFNNHRLTREERLRKPLTLDDAIAIREQCPSVERVGVEIFRQIGDFGNLPPATTKYKGQDMANTMLVGSTPEQFDLINASLADGRLYTDVDNQHRRNVAVLGADIVTQLFEHEDPVGKTIVVDGHNFEIIGALGKRKQFLGDNGDDRIVFTPYWTYRKIYPDAKEHFISARAYPNRLDEARDEITGTMRRRRHDKPSDPNSFGTSTAESIIAQFRQIISTVAVAMVVISSIGLLVGGIGVMNIMLVSVTERTREIGVRKAVGARRSDITWQFLLEAMTLTGAGGVMGIVGGCLLSITIKSLVPSLPSTVPLWSVAAGFIVATSVGLFFGLWPALKASRLDPIVALRYE
jgi:putative ABC transport system permease protein